MTIGGAGRPAGGDHDISSFIKDYHVGETSEFFFDYMYDDDEAEDHPSPNMHPINEEENSKMEDISAIHDNVQSPIKRREKDTKNVSYMDGTDLSLIQENLNGLGELSEPSGEKHPKTF